MTTQINGCKRQKIEGEGPNEMTEGVSVLTGDPKKAILKLSGPIIVAMLVTNAYNLINAFWVSGLGPDALAAVGFINPISLMVFGLSSGIGSGIASAISRKIGAKDRAGADDAAMHAMILVALISLLLTVPLCLLADPIVRALGVGDSFAMAVEYGKIIFAGTGFMVFLNIAYAMLRAEGDTNRTMNVMIAASIINAVLDPVLIYHAGMGIAGAAWGTVISTGLGCSVLVYWLMVKRDTYISLRWSSFSPSLSVMADILRVGLPASLEFILLALDAVIINSMMMYVAGSDAVAVYTGVWRVVTFFAMPVVAISVAVLSVAGASYGARRYGDISSMHRYSVKLGIVAGMAIGAIIWLLAPQIALLFTYSKQTSHLMPATVSFLSAMCLFYPFISPGVMASAIFQGVGKGSVSFILNFTRIVVFIAAISYTMGILLGMGEEGIWWGIIAGNVIGGTVSHIYTRRYIGRLEKRAVLEPLVSAAGQTR